MKRRVPGKRAWIFLLFVCIVAALWHFNPYEVDLLRGDNLSSHDVEIDRITYHFGDASVPPEYHRSYTITVAPDKIDMVVDSYIQGI